MKPSLPLALAVTLAVTIAMTPAAFSQDLLIEPDTLDFGAIPVGLTGLPDSYREFTVTNQSDHDLSLHLQADNLAHPESFELFSPWTAEIHPILRQIYDAVGCYRQDRGEDPSELYELFGLGYLHIDEEILWRWHFSLIGQDPITQIAATTAAYNNSILFDIQTGKFTGRYRSEVEPITDFELYSGQNRLFMLSYSPDEPEEIDGSINFIMEGLEARLNVTGSGYYKEALSLSTDRIDFGDTYTGRRIHRDLQATNTAEVINQVNFEVSNPGQFYVYDSYVADVHDYILAIDEGCKSYHQHNGEDPASVDELLDLGFISPSEELERQWTFSLIGQDPISEIEAVSTAELRRGPGHVVLLDVRTNTFYGFGFYNNVDNNPFYLGTGRGSTFKIGFKPDSLGQVEGTLRVRSYYSEDWQVFQDYEVALRGNGLSVTNPEPGTMPATILLNPAFPNPFNSTAIVSFQTPFVGEVNMSLVDVSGRIVRGFKIPASTGMMSGTSSEGRIVIDAAGLAAGNYWVRLSQGGQVESQRLVLVK